MPTVSSRAIAASALATLWRPTSESFSVGRTADYEPPATLFHQVIQRDTQLVDLVKKRYCALVKTVQEASRHHRHSRQPLERGRKYVVWLACNHPCHGIGPYGLQIDLRTPHLAASSLWLFQAENSIALIHKAPRHQRSSLGQEPRCCSNRDF